MANQAGEIARGCLSLFLSPSTWRAEAVLDANYLLDCGYVCVCVRVGGAN